VVLFLFVLLFISTIGTALTNSDPLFYGPTVVEGLRVYDVMSMSLTMFMILIPFLLARRVFGSTEGHRVLLKSVVIAAVGYAVLALYEIRMSPQLNVMVYGFFPHDWIQHFRAGGWRPVVFLAHALSIGIFFCGAVIAAFGLWRHEKGRLRIWLLGAGVFVLGTLFLAKTFGAFVIAVVMIVVLLALPKRIQMMLAASVTCIVLLYPTLRYADLVPTQRALAIAEWFDPDRAGSLRFRFINEDAMVEKARERPVFGWGLWGRSRVFDEEGRDTTVSDGYWAIVYGVGGWTRYIAEFGLLSFSVLALAFRHRRYEPDPVSVVLALVLVANLIDLIPNAGISPLTWMFAGALAGRLEVARRTADESDLVRVPADVDQGRRGAVVYRRADTVDGLSRNGVGASAQIADSPRFTRFPSVRERSQ
jgi:hypothetical protein